MRGEKVAKVSSDGRRDVGKDASVEASAKLMDEMIRAGDE